MRILVTGASGLLGANVAFEAVSAGHMVFGVGNRSTLNTQDFTVLTANLLDPGELDRVLQQTQPDWVINCSALANLEDCEKDPVLARRINSEFPGILAERCRKGGARLLHVSTDAVFDGLKGNYTEADEPNPLNVYAQSKLDGERAVAQANSNALIARVNLFGFSPSGRRSLAEFFLYNLMANKPVKGFTDVFFCPLLVNDIAHIFFKMLATDSSGRELSGLYHVFSAEALSKYEFGVRIANRFGLDAGLIAPVLVSDGGLVAARSPNLRMDVNKLSTDLGEVPPTFSPMLERFYTLYQEGYPQRVRGLVSGD